MPEAIPDAAARDRIRNELGATLFVEAGAGSGKTSALVGRILELVTSGTADLASIAAITFTEKAAAELADRVRAALEQRCADEPGSPAAERCRVALGQLDGAAIGTLHAFAQRLLLEFPVMAGLPPALEVLDEVSSQVAFDEEWARFLDALLGEPALRRPLLLLDAADVKLEAFRTIARRFEANWDLVEERLDRQPPEPPDTRRLVAAALPAVRLVAAEPCVDATDKLKARLDLLLDTVTRVAGLDDELDVVESLTEVENISFGGVGRKKSFPCDLDDLKARAEAARDGVVGVRQAVCQAAGKQVAAAIGAFTLASAHARQRSGRLQFHDLLVLARRLLTDPEHGPQVRERLHDRYRRILLDEFQDTDPIQIDLAVRIAAVQPDDGGAGARPWQLVPVTAGHLFLVGDPKQSIYRFRRADIGTFLAARDRFGADGGLVELITNFRTTEPVVEWVNDTFAPLMVESDDDDPGPPSQARFLPLAAVRPAAPTGPPVSVLGRHPSPARTKADDLRAVEAAEVTEAVSRAVAEGWPVDDGRGGWRPARAGDVTILVPARTSLPFLEDALDAAGIAFRTESSSLVYATRAVRDVLMVLRAVADPTDELALVSALRTPLLGCGDDDLFRFRHRGGRWNLFAEPPQGVPADDPVRRGLDYLRSLADERHWSSPSELLMRVCDDRRAFELGFAGGRPRDVWRRLRFVTDQARAWSDAVGGNLRQYLAWVGHQAAEGSRVSEAVLPEHDDDAVRIMTIHAAKGLEFPITVVSGMSTAPNVRHAGADVVFPPDGGIGYKFGRAVRTRDYEQWLPIDEQMGLDERIRLLYVACTRARDHLVVSLHRCQRKGEPEPARRTNAELLVAGMGTALDAVPDAVVPGLRPRPVPVTPAAAPPPFEVWEAARRSALASAAQPRTVAATALTEEGAPEPEPDPGLQKRPRDLDLPPWLKGRYGTAVGRAVHGVLQTVDLASGEGLGDAVAAQCEAEAVTDRAADVERLVRAALGSRVVVEAASAPHWREMLVCAPVAGRVLEGYVDLLYRRSDGLVIVDYKTASSADPADLDRRVDGYRNQGAAYALAVAAAAGEPVVDVVFLFLTPAGAVERHLDDLDVAVVELAGLVAAGAEVTVDN